MRTGFWKVGALAAGFLTASALAPSLFGQQAPAKPAASKKPAAATDAKPGPKPDAKPEGRKVALTVEVSAGSGGKGYTIEVKPANPTCRFDPKTVEIPAGGPRAVKSAEVTLENVEIRGADRNLSVAITVHEADGASRTVYRSYRVAAAPKPGRAEQFTCWMSSPAQAAVIAAEPLPARR